MTKERKSDLLRQLLLCHKLHEPLYQSPSPLPSEFLNRKKSSNRAVNTAATSRASSRGISSVSGSALAPVTGSNECSSATHGRTTSSVLARFAGNSQRCSTEKGGGSGWVMLGRPISSQASRRAVWKAVSERVSALPVGGVKSGWRLVQTLELGRAIVYRSHEEQLCWIL